MEAIKLSDAEERFAELFDRAARGQRFEIIKDRRSVVLISAADYDKLEEEAHYAALRLGIEQANAGLCRPAEVVMGEIRSMLVAMKNEQIGELFE